jgi:hypothetical protein
MNQTFRQFAETLRPWPSSLTGASRSKQPEQGKKPRRLKITGLRAGFIPSSGFYDTAVVLCEISYQLA